MVVMVVKVAVLVVEVVKVALLCKRRVFFGGVPVVSTGQRYQKMP